MAAPALVNFWTENFGVMWNLIHVLSDVFMCPTVLCMYAPMVKYACILQFQGPGHLMVLQDLVYT